MTIRSYLSSKIELMHAIVLSEVAVLLLLRIVLHHIRVIWTVIICLWVLFLMMTATIFFGSQIRCPICAKRVVRTMRHGGLWGQSEDIRYCTFC